MAAKSIVESLWVIDSAGNNYYTLANRDNFDNSKFSNVILSVNQLALQISNETINRFNIFDMVFMVLRPEGSNLFVVCKINPKRKEKKLTKHLQKILYAIKGNINLKMIEHLDEEHRSLVFSILDEFIQAK